MTAGYAHRYTIRVLRHRRFEYVRDAGDGDLAITHETPGTLSRMDSDSSFHIKTSKDDAITRMQARTLSAASVHEPVSETVSPSSVTNQECFVGLEIGRRLPYDVIAVDDLVDTSFLVQGETGYQNEPVLPGDHVLFVDGYDAHSLSPDEVHGLLRGRFCFLYVP